MGRSMFDQGKPLVLILALTLNTLGTAMPADIFLQPAMAAGNWYDNENTFFDRGKRDYNSGQFDQALRDFSDCLKLNPNRADFYYWRSLCFSALHQNDEALNDLNQAVKIDPGSGAIFLSRGLILSNQGKHQQAIEDFDQALKLDPSLGEARQNREFCMQELQKTKVAEQKTAVQAAVATNGGDTGAPEIATAPGAESLTTTTSSGYRPYTGKGDPKLAAMQKREKEAQAKLQAMKAETARLAAERAQAELQNKELAKKEKLAEEALERERLRAEAAEKRKLASASLPAGKQPKGAVASPAAPAEGAKPNEDTVKVTEDALEIVNRPVRDKWALVVGISNFQDSKLNLHYPAKDAQDFYNFLIKEGNFSKDHVKLLVNEQATRANILSDLGVKWLPHVANPDDLVLIYISSHGSPSEMDSGGVNYLVAYDTDIDNLLSSGLPMQDLSRTIKARVHSDRVVVILDACHSGAAEAGGKGLVRKGNVDADTVAQGTGQLVITSSDTEQVSWESKQYPNSVFTRCLIDALRKNGNATTLGEAFQSMKDQVQSQVLRERGVLQTPVLKSKWKGSDLRLSVPASSPQPAL